MRHRALVCGVSSRELILAVDQFRVFAFTSLSMIPAMIFFLAMQRKIVGGLSGAVKG